MSEELHVFSTKKLGLAAYIKYWTRMGHYEGEFVAKGRAGQRHSYTFKSERSLHDWEVQYLNSCCNGVDEELIGLRNMEPED